ncbi:MAG: aromatic ring-hydroxylating dioxygenase subunit alpha, partial [bacterium]
MSLYQRPLEPRIYCDPETLVSERGRLFAGCWQLAGHRSQMPQPGGYLVPDTLLSPTVITRSTEGDLH